MLAVRVNRSLRLLWSLLVVAVLGALSVGCAASNPAQGPQGSEGTAAENLATSEAIHGVPIRGPAVGSEVGRRIPVFSLGLADGTTLTSNDLLADTRPAFLFFFATT
jgi:hypothetical protein